MPYATADSFEEKFIGSARNSLSITAGFSLFALLFDAYELPTLIVVERLIGIYDQLLASTIGRVAEQFNLMVARLGYAFEIPPSWKHLFVWLAFYFSTIRYYPAGETNKVRAVQWLFRGYALLLAVAVSFLASVFFPNPSSVWSCIISTSILMLAVYLYYFVQHLYRATFDRIIENSTYGKSETWAQYFLRQERGTVQIITVYAISVVIFGMVCTGGGLMPRISLLLAIFSILVMLFFFSLGLLNAKEWSGQAANAGVSKYQLFLRAGNTKVARNFMLPISITTALVLLGYLFVPLEAARVRTH